MSGNAGRRARARTEMWERSPSSAASRGRVGPPFCERARSHRSVLTAAGSLLPERVRRNNCNSSQEKAVAARSTACSSTSMPPPVTPSRALIMTRSATTSSKSYWT